MIHKARVALIVEALSQFPRHAQAMINLAQEQRAAVGAKRAAGKIGHNPARTQVLK